MFDDLPLVATVYISKEGGSLDSRENTYWKRIE